MLQARLQVFLGGLLFLWGGGKPSAGAGEGELCRAWSYGNAPPEPSRAAFQCPRRQDRADAKYCCGHCRLPFCCPRGETRLDWRRCRRALPNPAGITHARTTTPAAAGEPHANEIAVYAFIALCLCIILGLILRRCRNRYRRRQRALQLSNVFGNLGELHPPPPSPFWLAFAGTPPPYAEDPPAYSIEYPQVTGPPPALLPAVHFRGASAGNQEDAVTLGPLVHRNVPSHSSEADSSRDNSVDP